MRCKSKDCGGNRNPAKSLAAGFSEHLVKPVDFVSIEQAISRIAQPVEF